MSHRPQSRWSGSLVGAILRGRVGGSVRPLCDAATLASNSDDARVDLPAAAA